MWNTRRRDEVTGYYMYKYRHYDPQLGRWPSRDPIEESGGYNLYAFVGNNPVSRWDRLGLAAGDKTNAIGVMQGFVSNLQGSILLRETSLINTANKLINYGNASKNLSVDASAGRNSYFHLTHHINLNGLGDTNKVFHEFAHAYNGRNDGRFFGHPEFNGFDDEGIAWALDYTVSVASGAMAVENVIYESLGGDCDEARKNVTIAYGSMWAQAYGNLTKTFSSEDRDMTIVDFRSLWINIGETNINCKYISDKLNTMFKDNECCIYFSCDHTFRGWQLVENEGIRYVVSPSAELHDGFEEGL